MVNDLNEKTFKLLPADLVVTSKTFGFLRNILIEQLGIEKAKEILTIERNIEDFLKLALDLHVSFRHISNISVYGIPFENDNKYYFNNISGV
ncbi:hypothetical protein [Psychrobacillus psychrotolerans]|uniref:hypothetical protein n=1 Tax=Psychrobacillus psychrotolerans TaxID=126156 RepID=UPI003988D159